MHKTFFASGFLYHLPSEQILLQHDKSLSSLWSLFEEQGNKNENPISVFQKAVYNKLHIKLHEKIIYPVYDYFKKDTGANYYIFYAQIALKNKENFSKNNSLTEWLTFKQVTKLPLSDQAKQDIIVTQRVIKAKARDEEAKLIQK